MCFQGRMILIFFKLYNFLTNCIFRSECQWETFGLIEKIILWQNVIKPHKNLDYNEPTMFSDIVRFQRECSPMRRNGDMGKINPGYHKSYPAVKSFFIVVRSLRQNVTYPAIIEWISRIFFHADRPVHCRSPFLDKHRLLLSAYRDQGFTSIRA
jgi:hypothetical protein